MCLRGRTRCRSHTLLFTAQTCANTQRQALACERVMLVHLLSPGLPCFCRRVLAPFGVQMSRKPKPNWGVALHACLLCNHNMMVMRRSFNSVLWPLFLHLNAPAWLREHPCLTSTVFYLLYELARCVLRRPLNQIHVSVSGTMMSVWDEWAWVSYMSTQQWNPNLFHPQKPPKFLEFGGKCRSLGTYTHF